MEVVASPERPTYWGAISTRAMKMRLLLMGGIILILGIALLATRGLATSFLGLLVVGVVLLVLGLLWK